MSQLPPVAPPVLADAVDALPGRLRRRLDETVDQARHWPVTADGDAAVLRVDDDTTVRLAPVVRVDADATCTCLLAPRCLHRTAALAIAPVLDDSRAPAPAVPCEAQADAETVRPDQGRDEAAAHQGGHAEVAGDDSAARAGTGGLTATQTTAAQTLWQAAVPVLEAGIAGAGAAAQAHLLRAVHQARAAGLYRAGAAGVRVVESIRAALAEQARFRLAELTEDLRELLTVCHLLENNLGNLAVAMGTARREYEPIGSLRLWGLCTETVLTTSGYAGVTYLCDQDRRVWTVSDIRPGGLAQARSAADAMVTLGEVRLNHREAGRSGLIVNDAAAAASGRLSAGARVKAVRANGLQWTEPPLAGLWNVPLTEQAARFRDGRQLPVALRPAAHDLVFLQGTLTIVDNGAALDVPDAGLVRLTPSIADPGLPVVANLRQLVRSAAGRPVQLIGRFAGPRRIHALALGADWLPPDLSGHVDLMIDRLQRADLATQPTSPNTAKDPGGADRAETASAEGDRTSFADASLTGALEPAALQLLRHRVERAVAGGRPAIRTPSAADAARLVAAQMPYGATVLTALHAAAQQRTRDAFGRVEALDSSVLARAWLAAATYTSAADADLATAGWLTLSS